MKREVIPMTFDKLCFCDECEQRISLPLEIEVGLCAICQGDSWEDPDAE